MSVIGNKIRVYDLAREVKQDTRRIIEELRREGADVDVPSNSVSKELAEKIRNRYFPKVSAAPRRLIKVIKEKTSADSQHVDDSAFKTEDHLKPEANKIKVLTSKILRPITEEPPKTTGPKIFGASGTTVDAIITELKVDCRECIRPTKHNLIHSVEIEGLGGKETYQIVQCMGCDSVSFRRSIFRRINQSNNNEEVELYPSRIKGRQLLRLGSIPPTIAQIYEEVHIALSNKLLIVATTSMRTLIELVCKDQNSKAGTLKDKIDDLVRRRLLTPKNAKNLHKLRDFGNIAAHEAHIQSEDILNKCIDIIEHLLKDIYSPEISTSKW